MRASASTFLLALENISDAAGNIFLCVCCWWHLHLAILFLSFRKKKGKSFNLFTSHRISLCVLPVYFFFFFYLLLVVCCVYLYLKVHRYKKKKMVVERNAGVCCCPSVGAAVALFVQAHITQLRTARSSTFSLHIHTENQAKPTLVYSHSSLPKGQINFKEFSYSTNT